MKKIRSFESVLNLPTPLNISVWWNIGSLLGVLLGMQIVTGIFLSLHYSADMINTFNAVVHIMRDVPGGWLFRAMHANGASMFFLLMYLHIGRGLYYQSYALQVHTWFVGVTIFLLSMATAFLGYVLPWGQMSYWGATVITNLLSAIPYLGDTLVTWVWGGFSVNQATLNRFYSFHFLLPFAIALAVVVHLATLHAKGSSNPLGSLNHISKISFHPYFTYKDVVGLFAMLFFFATAVLFFPTLMTDPENFVEANPMVTPTHIQPEWYFLFAYAILRSVPSKIGGVVALLLAVLKLYFFPVASRFATTHTSYIKLSQVIFWLYVVIFILLSWLGACPVEEPYITLAPVLTILFFFAPICYIFSHFVWLKLLMFFIPNARAH